MKIIALVFLVLFSDNGANPNEFQMERKNPFEIVVKISGLGRNYTGCGAMNYAIAVTGSVQNDFDKSRFGEKVILIFSCPETLNNLPGGQLYKLKVDFFDAKKVPNIVFGVVTDTMIKTRFHVFKTAVVLSQN